MYVLYLLQSQKDHSFYIGITGNLKRRLSEHNKRLSRYTKYKRPLMLIYCEVYRSSKDALTRERQLKKHKTGWIKLRERLQNSILREQS